MIKITATQKPKWFQLRWKLSNILVKLARRIYPENPEVTAFYMQLSHDQLITGKHIVRVNPADLFTPQD